MGDDTEASVLRDTDIAVKAIPIHMLRMWSKMNYRGKLCCLSNNFPSSCGCDSCMTSGQVLQTCSNR